MSRKEILFSPHHLQSYLSLHGVPIHLWGQDDAKTVAHLYQEIKRQDSQLIQEDGELIRKLKFVEVDVQITMHNQRLKLVEDRQVFNEGKPNQRLRRRPQYPSAVKEKIHFQEDPDQAVIRAIKEEIGRLWFEHDLDLLKPEKIQERQFKKESLSYPGLLTFYHGHYYHLELPKPLFDPGGYQEIQPDITTYFVWKEV